MSKTLTEQYRKGKLPTGFYYANLFQYDGEDREDRDFEDIVFYYNKTNKFVYEDCYDGVSNIIDKVPDYDQITKLEKKVELLQKQLKEAQNLIIYCSTGDHLGYEIRCENYRITHHLSKWGVK